MAYTDGKAAPRRVPGSTPLVSAAPAPAGKSAQSLTVGQSAKFSQPSLASHASVGNQVRIAGNTKGTGVAGRPASLAVAGKTSTKPAVENPSGSSNKPGKF
jgi:hypothetical protein